MNKKTIILALALALPLTASAFPGDQPDIEARHANRVEHLTKSLDLTPEQQTKVKDLFADEATKLKAIHEETQNRLHEILSKEQLVKLEELKKEQHGKWKKKFAALKDKISEPNE
ncbi:MAG: hypothetical protein NTV43_07975 [Methylococcales bacterium]|nr:hypothetical protein [Methylococcales bacterium]